MPKTTEIRPLTSLRFIAALLVFFHHFGGYGYPAKGNNILESMLIEGHLGVTIFFVLSGFLITHRYFSNPAERPINLFQYFVKRIARIYPLYYFLTACIFIYSNRVLFTPESLIPFTLNQGWFALTRFAYIPTAWSITVEESFYFLAPLFFMAAFMIIDRRSGLKNRRVAVVMSLLLLVNILLPITGLGLKYLSIITSLSQPFGFMYGGYPFTDFAYTTIFYRVFDFSVGICLAYVFRHSDVFSSVNAHRRMVATALSIASIGGLMLSAWLMNAAGGVYTSGIVFDYLAAVSAGLLILSLTEPTTWLYTFLSRPICVYLGRISYALYLIQLAPFTGNLLDLMYIKVLDVQLGKVLFTYIRLNIISAFLYETVEKYGSRLVLRFSRGVIGKASPGFIKKSKELDA